MPFRYVAEERFVLKNCDKEPIKLPDDLNARTINYLSDREWWIARINKVNASHILRYIRTGDGGERAYGYTLPNLRATYNNGCFDQGGRLYGKFQNLTGSERKTLTIDGRPTIELDYQCLHPAMLYNSNSLELREDAYLLYPGQSPVMRRAVKIAFNALLNAPSEAAALNACNLALGAKDKRGRTKSREERQEASELSEELKTTSTTFKEILTALKTKHAAISSYFGNGHGIRLQNKDVELVYDVCDHFCQKNVPILPVHDSFIVWTAYEGELDDAMRAAYLDKFGFVPTISGQSRSRVKMR